jgi:hypothetical protein
MAAMAYAFEYDPDVLISYHQADNYDSWVTSFHAQLENRLTAILGRIKIGRVVDLGTEISGQLKNPAILLLVSTPGLWQSGSCQELLQKFRDMAEKNGGITAGLKLRIIKAVKLPPEASGHSIAHLPVMPGAQEFEFYKTVGEARFREFDPDTRDFRNALDNLAYEIRDILRAIREKSNGLPPSPNLPVAVPTSRPTATPATPVVQPIVAANATQVAPTTYKGRSLVFSTNSWLAYKISEEYYDGEHCVWCSPILGNLGNDLHAESSIDQPVISGNPFRLYCELLTESQGGDAGSPAIMEERTKICARAAAKQKLGEISKEVEGEIYEVVGDSEPGDFRPVIYVIPYALVKEQAKRISSQGGTALGRSNRLSDTLLIEKLQRGYFDVIEYVEKFGKAQESCV